MFKKLLPLVLLTTVCSFVCANDGSYEAHVVHVNDSREQLIDDGNEFSFGLKFTRTADTSDESWKQTVDAVCEILNSTNGDLETIEKALDFARNEKPEDVRGSVQASNSAGAQAE